MGSWLIWDSAVEDSEKPGFLEKLEPAKQVHSAMYFIFAGVSTWHFESTHLLCAF